MCFISYIVPDYEKYFTKIIDINIDQSGEGFLIWSDLTIKSFHVMSVEYNSDSNLFSDITILKNTQFSDIQIGEAIKVGYYLPCGIPSYRFAVSEQNGSDFSFIPILSGLNGSLGLFTRDQFVWGTFSKAT